MFIFSWGDISMALTGAMTCLVLTTSPLAVERAEACVPDSTHTLRRMRWSALIPDVVGSTTLHSAATQHTFYTQTQRLDWHMLLLWDGARLSRLWQRPPLTCPDKGGAA